MPNIELLEKSIPVAPIRIAALAGCRDLAEEVDKKLVKFRKELVENKKLSIIPQGVRVSVLAKAKESSKNLSVVQTFLLW